MPYFLGIDAGGTKTNCLIGDESGQLLGFGASGPGNYEVNGVEAARVEIERALSEALSEAGLQLSDITAAGLGVAGADIEDDFQMLERDVCTPLLGDLRRDFKNDSAAALRGGTHNRYGIVIACGTGCVCAGRNASGEFGRVGGHGDEFGDECSGTSIGMEGLRAVFQARENVIPPTKMTPLFVERAGCQDVDELFYRLYTQRIGFDALQPMAPLVFDAALEGDSAACAILVRGGTYLGMMVNAVARNVGMPSSAYDVVMAGSVFKGSSPALVEAMASEIATENPHANLVRSVYEPVVGALLMGMDLEQAADESTYSALETSLELLEDRRGVRLKSE